MTYLANATSPLLASYACPVSFYWTQRIGFCRLPEKWKFAGKPSALRRYAGYRKRLIESRD